MSAEHFETVLSCDMRTAPDGRGIEYAHSQTGEPRWSEDGRGWAECLAYADQVVRIAAQAVRDQPMDGLTGDHPHRREQAAAILDAAAEVVRVLALDDAHDGALTDKRWAGTLTAVFVRTQVPAPAGVPAPEKSL